MSQFVAVRDSVAPRPARQESAPAAAREPGYHLFVESLERGVDPAPRSAAELPVLAVPAGVSHVAPDRWPLALVSRKPRVAALVLEPVQSGGRSRLLVLTPPSLRARLNGLVVPAVALLGVGDQLQLAARALLHVSEYRVGGATRPAPQLVGSPCGVCRLPLVAETTVYVCTCGVPLHLEGPPRPAAERLECALFGDCPSCGAGVLTESGHVWLPEL